jgi:pimeloyl-ACP methyl ester carboxylesterase
MLMPDRVCTDCTLEDPAFEPLPGARAFFGYADGAAYRIEIPDDWNGTLLLWARGVGGLNDAGTGFTTQIGFGGYPPGRELVTSFGAGWAASTYAETGYAPARGVDDLLTVKEIAEAEVGPAQWTYCVGASMGGGTAQLMAQEFPDEIDGALAFCGALSNVEIVDYLASWHAIAHWLIGEAPAATDASGLIGWAAALGSGDDGGLHLSPLGEQFAAVIEELSGGPRWGFREGLARQWQINFALGALYWPAMAARGPLPAGAILPHDGSLLAFDTRDVVYGAPPEAGVDVDRLNEEVVRFQAPPGLRADPALGVASGFLGVPLLTIKTSGDLWTPISLDRSYARKVEAAGYGDLLVQRAVRRAGHCNFTELREMQPALLDLTRWVTEGVRPEGEDLTGDDLSGAGVRFTSPFDADDPLAPSARSLPRRRLAV